MRGNVIWNGMFSGLLTGPVLVILAVLISETLSFLEIPPRIVVTLHSPLILIPASILISIAPLLRDRKKKRFRMAILLFVLTSYISLGYTLEFLKMGPKGEEVPMLYLFTVKYKGESVASGKYWERVEWKFYAPECYFDVYAVKLKNHSLQVAAFYYADFKTYPLHYLIKSLYVLFCGKTVETAYKSYKNLLVNSGFLITEEANGFTAKNDTVIVYCRLDGRIIMIAKADKKEEWLLNSIVRKVTS